MYVQKLTVSATTDGAGAATVYTERFSGRILSVGYIKAGSNNFDDTVDFACTLDDSLQNVWTEANVTASAVRAPGQATHNQDGTVVSGVNDYITAVNDRLKVAVTNAGASKNGSFYAVVG